MITKNSLTDLENITKLRFCQIIKNKIMSPDYLNMCHVTCHSDFTFSPVPTSNIVSDWTQIGLITIFVPLIQHIFCFYWVMMPYVIVLVKQNFNATYRLHSFNPDAPVAQ